MKTRLSTPILTALMLSAGLVILGPAQAEESFELRQPAIGLRIASVGQLAAPGQPGGHRLQPGQPGRGHATSGHCRSGVHLGRGAQVLEV